MACAQKRKADKENNVEPEITANKAKTVSPAAKKARALPQKSAQTNKSSTPVQMSSPFVGCPSQPTSPALDCPFQDTTPQSSALIDLDTIPDKVHPVKPSQASVDNFWAEYGNTQTRTVLAWSGNEQEFEINAQYFILRMNLIVRGISPNKAEAIFMACIPTFVTRSSSDAAKAHCLGILVRESNYVNWIMHARITFYAKKWVESPAGVVYRSLYELHK